MGNIHITVIWIIIFISKVSLNPCLFIFQCFLIKIIKVFWSTTSATPMIFSSITVASIFIGFATLTLFFILFNIFPLLVEICVIMITIATMIKTKTISIITTTCACMTTTTVFPIVIVPCHIHLWEWSCTSGTSLVIFHQ